MASIHYRRELCPDLGELLRRFITRRDALLLSVDGGLPGELAAVQRAISWLAGKVGTGTDRPGADGSRADVG